MASGCIGGAIRDGMRGCKLEDWKSRNSMKKSLIHKYFKRIHINAEIKKLFFIRVLQATFASPQQSKSVTFEDRLENIS